jgi:Ni/Co efflux regulator RcnB
MSMTSKTVGPRRRGLFRLLAGGLLTAAAASVIAMPVANAQCDGETVGNSINSYLQRHPDLHQQLQARSEAEGGGPNVLDYLNRHPDVRQHLIDLSQQCAP